MGTRCFAYDPETKRQNSDWVGETSFRPKKLKFQSSRIKTMLLIVFDSQGVVHEEFVPQRGGGPVNAKFYNAFSRFVQLRSDLEIFFLLRDNAPAHTAASVL